jgi:hypothetical protein
MLPGMDEDVVLVEAVQRLDHRGHLDDFRSGPYDCDDPGHGETRE